jgi:peptidoglycan-associated lipoprotein
MFFNRKHIQLLLFAPILFGSSCGDNSGVTDQETEVVELSSPENMFQVAAIDPAFGPEGTVFDVTVYGSGLSQSARVRFGENEAVRVQFTDTNTITATVPPLTAGNFDVTVINPDGNAQTLRNALNIEADFAEVAQEVQCEDGTVYFGFNSDTMEPESASVLSSILDCLREATSATVRFEGHTDERGTTEYNLALGNRRVDSVRHQAISQGLSPSRSTATSYGEERPVAGGHDEQSWSRNRRVEIKVNQ